MFGSSKDGSSSVWNSSSGPLLQGGGGGGGSLGGGSSSVLGGGVRQNSSTTSQLSAPGGGVHQPQLHGANGTSSSSANAGEKPTICKYFLNGGCLRGDGCQFLHELPDERHLDVDGVGFIFNTNVHNAQKPPVGGAAAGSGAVGGGGSTIVNAPTTTAGSALSSNSATAQLSSAVNPSSSSSATASTMKMTAPSNAKKSQIPKYRPPEPHLAHNLPPALHQAFESNTTEVQAMLYRTMFEKPALRI